VTTRRACRALRKIAHLAGTAPPRAALSRLSRVRRSGVTTRRGCQARPRSGPRDPHAPLEHRFSQSSRLRRSRVTTRRVCQQPPKSVLVSLPLLRVRALQLRRFSLSARRSKSGASSLMSERQLWRRRSHRRLLSSTSHQIVILFVRTGLRLGRSGPTTQSLCGQHLLCHHSQRRSLVTTRRACQQLPRSGRAKIDPKGHIML